MVADLQATDLGLGGVKTQLTGWQVGQTVRKWEASKEARYLTLPRIRRPTWGLVWPLRLLAYHQDETQPPL